MADNEGMAVTVTHTIRVYDPETPGFDYDLSCPLDNGVYEVTHGGKNAGRITESGGGLYAVDVPTIFGAVGPLRRVCNRTGMRAAVTAIDNHWAAQNG